MEKKSSALELLERRIMNTSINVYGQMVFYYSEFKLWLDEAKAIEKKQRGYSEIDLEVAFFEGRENNLTFNQWLEQFKNQKK